MHGGRNYLPYALWQTDLINGWHFLLFFEFFERAFSPPFKKSTAAGFDFQAMRKDLTPSESAFENFLCYLDPQRERAAQKYVQLQRKLVFWLQQQQCKNAQELADHTVDIVVAQLFEGLHIRAADPIDYCLGVARNLLQRQRGLDLRQVSLDDLSLQSEKQQAHEAFIVAMENDSQEQRADCLRHCLQRLSSKDRRFLESYYHDDWAQQVRQRQRLAAEHGMTPIALRTRAHRLRAMLKACVERCR